MCDYANAQQVAEKQYYADQAKDESPVQAGLGYTPGPRSPLEEMERRLKAMTAEADALVEGIVFLRDNPQINEFIRLIRKGAVSI